MDPGAEVATATEWAFEDPNTSRHFVAPSAIPLGKGRAYVSQRAAILTNVGLGVGEHVSIEAGLALPALAVGGGVGSYAVRVGVPVAQDLHAGAAVQGLDLLLITGEVSFYAPSVALADVTWGTPDSHVSVGIGPSGMLQGGEVRGRAFGFWFRSGPAVATVAANHRVSDHVALVTDNWVFAEVPGVLENSAFDDPFQVVASGGVRLMGRRFAADVALVGLLFGPNYPLPWLDLTWNFGGVASG
jgi:hypothetical protein